MDVINNILGTLANFIGVFSAIFAAGAWYQAWKLKDDMAKNKKREGSYVNVKLRAIDGNTEIPLPVALYRKELSRAEVLGYIGMIPRNEKYVSGFKLSYPNQVEFIEEIRKLANTETDSELIIPCSEEELAQFDVEPTDIS